MPSVCGAWLWSPNAEKTNKQQKAPSITVEVLILPGSQFHKPCFLVCDMGACSPSKLVWKLRQGESRAQPTTRLASPIFFAMGRLIPPFFINSYEAQITQTSPSQPLSVHSSVAVCSYCEVTCPPKPFHLAKNVFSHSFCPPPTNRRSVATYLIILGLSQESLAAL